MQEALIKNLLHAKVCNRSWGYKDTMKNRPYLLQQWHHKDWFQIFGKGNEWKKALDLPAFSFMPISNSNFPHNIFLGNFQKNMFFSTNPQWALISSGFHSNDCRQKILFFFQRQLSGTAGHGVRKTWIWILPHILTSCVTLRKSLNLYRPQFPYS